MYINPLRFLDPSPFVSQLISFQYFLSLIAKGLISPSSKHSYLTGQMSFPRDRSKAPKQNEPQHHSKTNSAVSVLLGQAGQALGAVAAPSSAASADSARPVRPVRPGSSTTSHQRQPDNPTTISPSLGIGQQHPQQHPPPRRPASSSTSPATDLSSLHLHLQPPLQSSAAGVSSTGTGIGFGSNQRPISAAAASTSTNHPPPLPTSHSSAGLSSFNRPAPYANPAQFQFSHSRPSSSAHDPRALPPPDVLIPGLRPLSSLAPGSSTSTGTGSGTGVGAGSGVGLGSSSGSGPSPRPMFDLPSIPTSDDDFASLPYLNKTPATASNSTPTDTMSQQQQYTAAPRRTGAYDEQHHMSGSSQYQHGQLSPRDYSTPGAAPHIKLEQAPSNPSSYQGTPVVPSALQPGPTMGRSPVIGATTAPTLPTIQGSMSQQQDYPTPSKPSLSLSYTRSSPGSGGYDGSNATFSPYSPTTPGGAGASSSQFMSPTDRSYNAPGSQRNISHTPLGLADIRPRADSSLSDGMPSGVEFGTQNPPPGTSNYMAPWATYAFDWCKWAPQGNGAGKVAMGSYLEDGHNFVSFASRPQGIVATTHLGTLG